MTKEGQAGRIINEWWPSCDNPTALGRGYDLNLRGVLALTFGEKWGMVQGENGAEDSAGRATLEVMPVPDVIDRAVAMADGLVTKREALGWIRTPRGSLEECAARVGDREAIRAAFASAARQQQQTVGEIVKK